MDNRAWRKFTRYDTFIPLSISAPAVVGDDVITITGWVKNVSPEGIASEFYVLSPDETYCLLDMVEEKQQVTASISLQNAVSLKAKYKIIWGTFSEHKKFYTMGLKIFAIDPLSKDTWDSFVKQLSLEQNPRLFKKM